MPGNPLNITLPTVGATVGPTYATQINAAIQALIDDIEAKIVPSEIQINEDLTFQGTGAVSYGITDLARAQFDAQGSTLGTGNTNTIYAYNDELYFQDGTGVNVPITAGGAVAGAPGNINGSGYGSGGVEILWDGANGDYQFKSGATTYADLIFTRAEFRNGANTMTMLSNVTSDYSIRWPAAGPSANDLMVLDGSGNISFTDTIAGAKTFSAALTASNGLTVTTGGATVTAGGLTVSAGGADVTGNVEYSGDLLYSSARVLQYGATAWIGNGTYFFSAGTVYHVTDAATTGAFLAIPLEDTGCRITRVDVWVYLGSATTVNLDLLRVDTDGSVSIQANDSTAITGSWQQLSLTGLTVTTTGNYNYTLRVYPNSSTSFRAGNAKIFYDHP